MSLFIGGGQEYHGQTATRDKKVVHLVAQLLREKMLPIQIVTGGTAGVPDDFAKLYGPNVVDVVSSEYLKQYKERAPGRPYWVAGKTQEERRIALAANPDIFTGFFVQGGQFTAHEIKLFQDAGKAVIVFSGSGGASGGQIDYKGWRYVPYNTDVPYHSQDPDADPVEIATALVETIVKTWKEQYLNQ